jgi:hypothetical protein
VGKQVKKEAFSIDGVKFLIREEFSLAQRITTLQDFPRVKSNLNFIPYGGCEVKT